MSLQAVYPNGRSEVAPHDVGLRCPVAPQLHLRVTTSSPLLPAGTVIVMTGWYENTEDNPLTDPEAWYARGSRTVDEMSHAWIAVTHLTEEGLRADQGRA